MSILEVKNLSVGYGTVCVADDINFKLEKGAYMCVVGANGAGKSTLIKTLAGIIPKLVGEIIFGENGVKAGYLAQRVSDDGDFPATVEEVVLSGRLKKGFRPFYTKKDRAAAESAMLRLGIDRLKKRSFSTLSGGQRQRVLLCRALLAAKDVLILDEPVTGLDPEASETLYKTVDELNRFDKITIIEITHDVSVALRYASCVLKVGEQCAFFESVRDYEKTCLGDTDLNTKEAE